MKHGRSPTIFPKLDSSAGFSTVDESFIAMVCPTVFYPNRWPFSLPPLESSEKRDYSTGNTNSPSLLFFSELYFSFSSGLEPSTWAIMFVTNAPNRAN